MPKTKQDPTARKAYAKARTLYKPYTPKEMLSPAKTLKGRMRVVLGDKKR